MSIPKIPFPRRQPVALLKRDLSSPARELLQAASFPHLLFCPFSRVGLGFELIGQLLLPNLRQQGPERRAGLPAQSHQLISFHKRRTNLRLLGRLAALIDE